MARLNMSSLIQAFPKTGTALAPTFTALTGSTGIQWSSTGREVLAIINGATASNYTINYAPAYGGAVVTPITAACPTSNTAPVFLGPFNAYFTQNDGNNDIYIDFSSVATVTVAVLQMPGV
jgi:hypothetical protein